MLNARQESAFLMEKTSSSVKKCFQRIASNFWRNCCAVSVSIGVRLPRYLDRYGRTCEWGGVSQTRISLDAPGKPYRQKPDGRPCHNSPNLLPTSQMLRFRLRPDKSGCGSTRVSVRCRQRQRSDPNCADEPPGRYRHTSLRTWVTAS